MSIAVAHAQRSRSVRSEIRRRNPRQPRAIALLRSFGVKKRTRQAINISPLRGEATNNLVLHFQLEFAKLNTNR